MLTRIVKLTFEPEHVPAFLALFETVKEKIRGFDGCHGVTLYRDVHDPHIFFTYSIWENERALHEYRHSALFDDTWAKTRALFGGKPMAWSLEEAG